MRTLEQIDREAQEAQDAADMRAADEAIAYLEQRDRQQKALEARKIALNEWHRLSDLSPIPAQKPEISRMKVWIVVMGIICMLALLGAVEASGQTAKTHKTPSIENKWTAPIFSTAPVYAGSPVDCSFWSASQKDGKCVFMIKFSNMTPKVTCSPVRYEYNQQVIICTWKAPKQQEKP